MAARLAERAGNSSCNRRTLVCRVAARTGIAAILAGALYFLAQAGELVFDSPEELFVALGGLGLAAFVVAIWGLRPLASGRLALA